MQVNSVTHNIIKSAYISKSNINLLSDNTNSLFDYYISNIDNISVFPLSNYNNYVSYDAILSNNPIAFSPQASQLASLHINSIIYFHSKCPNNFKKEDKFLLKKSINNSCKIFSSSYIMNDWSFEMEDKNTYILPYGIAVPNIDLHKTISVVVLNTNNNPTIDTLYKYIKQIFKDAILINHSTDDNIIHNALRQAAVCVETESAFNIITAIANGCAVISSMDWIQEYGMFKIHSYENLIQEIHTRLQEYNYEKAGECRDEILKKYDNQIFMNSFNQIITNIKQEPCLYVKTN